MRDWAALEELAFRINRLEPRSLSFYDDRAGISSELSQIANALKFSGAPNVTRAREIAERIFNGRRNARESG